MRWSLPAIPWTHAPPAPLARPPALIHGHPTPRLADLFPALRSRLASLLGAPLLVPRHARLRRRRQGRRGPGRGRPGLFVVEEHRGQHQHHPLHEPGGGQRALDDGCGDAGEDDGHGGGVRLDDVVSVLDHLQETGEKSEQPGEGGEREGCGEAGGWVGGGGAGGRGGVGRGRAPGVETGRGGAVGMRMLL
eukprot:scaffold8014_cov125-Isochrysis_galbana.AAC.7